MLSLTLNRRIRVKLTVDADTPVPSVTGLWPVAGWLEREVFDLYGVAFAGNPDLRRILTDYGFSGHPMRKDFPLTGHVELRYSEAEKRVIYEPVSLPQDFRTFDFLMPWEGPEYRLPGDEKAEGEAPGAPTQARADGEPPQMEASCGRDAEDGRHAGRCRRWQARHEQAQKDARKSNAAKAEEEVSKDSGVPDPMVTGSGRPPAGRRRA